MNADEIKKQMDGIHKIIQDIPDKPFDIMLILFIAFRL